MQITTARVINGHVDLSGLEFAEGEMVAIVSQGDSATFTLSESEEAEILESMAEIERGEFVTLDALLARFAESP